MEKINTDWWRKLILSVEVLGVFPLFTPPINNVIIFGMETEKYNVVQANNFIRNTKWTLSKDGMKIFKLLVAMIDTKNPPKDNTVYFTKAQLISVLSEDGTIENKNHSYYKSILERLTRTSVVLQDDDKAFIVVSLIHKIFWNKDTDIISARFDEDIMKYLIVASKFLEYPLDNVRGFKSKYGIVLYEYLLSYNRQYGENIIILSIADLRRLTNTEKQYKRYVDLEEYVISAGVDDLNNAGVEILARYEKIKTGKKVSHIRFIVRKRTSASERAYYPIVNDNQLSLFDTEIE